MYPRHRSQLNVDDGGGGAVWPGYRMGRFYPIGRAPTTPLPVAWRLPGRNIPAGYLGLALCTANQLLMKALMITTMGPALSAIARALPRIQLPVDASGRGT
jgi:hypothetical protein